MKNLIVLGLLLGSVQAGAQTLFSYGNEHVSKQEFLRAYNKNTNGENPDDKSYREYLELYTRFKLKVRAAYDKKMDTLPSQVAELQNFKNQVAEGYMNDESTMKSLTDEAFQRSLKDIHLAHIFIPYFSSNDTLTAFKKAAEAYKQLSNGTAFGKVAAAFSADSSSLGTGGDIGFITVFTLPYMLENMAYSTLPGKFSKPFRTKAGYHIFKNLEERKAIGKITITHIQLLFPPDATDSRKKEIKNRADSLYAALKKGASFSEFVEKFSDDNLTYQTGGQMPPFGVGSYDPAFEKAAFDLHADGDISQPLLTSQGYHIIKRVSLVPVNTNPDSVEGMAVIAQQLRNDLRINIAHDILVKKAWQLTKLKKEKYNEAEMLAYYKNHLEDYNPDYAMQIREFKDGNLLFEIMQSTIWEKAATDSVGLRKYYAANKTKYLWEPSADVIIFTCNDSATAIATRTSFSINTSSWRDIAKENETKVQADSGRYELSQLPLTDMSVIKAGAITQPQESKTEKTVSFIYIRKLYSDKSVREFNDARGFVLNDYQSELEEKWVSQLKSKYPVKVNEEVLKSL